MNQITLHKKIDSLIQAGPTGASVDVVKTLTQVNPDARQYFYTKADERWLTWFWDNGLLDAVKKKSEDQTRYGYRTPELNYLVKVAEKEPAKVVDIMLAVPVSAENLNPEVVDRFLWICSILPAEQLARMVSKIRDGKWISLMGSFNEWGFEYEKMLKTLADAKDYDGILVLAEAILAIRTKEEIEKTSNRASTDNPFYFSDLSYTKVFERLVNVDDGNKENALAITTRALCNVVLAGERDKDEEVFEVSETFHLFDVDFFEIQLGEKERLSHRDDVLSLAAAIKTLAVSSIGEKCNDAENAQRLYKKHFASLPDSRSMWRLKLFVLSLCPEAFKDELKRAFFRLFEVERYHELISGTEYQKALRAGFPVLSENDKREYVKRVIEYFTKKDQEKENEKEDWHIRYGSRILSMIADQLAEKEKQTAKGVGFTLDPNYEPEPSIGTMRGGTVRPKGPIPLEEFGKLSTADIAEKLRTEWTPEKLRSQNTSDDFLNPLNAEGAGELLRADIPKRLQNYIENAGHFFERDVLDQHYTYSFLRGIEETFRENKTNVSDINWDNLIALCITIKESSEAKPFDSERRERDTFDAWLSGWTGVHSAMTDVIQELISERDGKVVVDFLRYRDQLFGIISYLLNYPDPVPEDEKIETAKMTTGSPGSGEQLVSDPYSMAINTVRGRAFQAFTLFVYQDGKGFAKEEKSKISLDVKELYETVLKDEKTRALMFMFGHYLPSFYFRDIEWIRRLLPQIFPEEPTKKDLYLAAWEGYLANNLYQEIFFDPDIQKLYERGITLAPEEYTKRRYFREIDEGIAIHIALASMYYEKFGFNHPLFKAFWESDSNRHAKFISFIGRSFISGDNAKSNVLLKENPRSRERLKEFWDWMLEQYKDPKPLTEFGFWINTDKEIFDISWLAERIRKTLERIDGVLEWDYGLTKSITVLAKESPEDTLSITRLHFLNGGIRGSEQRRPLHVDEEWFEAFKILYTNPKTKEGVYTLINDLIREGSSTFWKLKDILNP